MSPTRGCTSRNVPLKIINPLRVAQDAGRPATANPTCLLIIRRNATGRRASAPRSPGVRTGAALQANRGWVVGVRRGIGRIGLNVPI